ncbi:ATP-dependent Clp protease adaptor ClpS [Desulfuromonas thiophila]|uniref:ATP-dependent Clp protease adaptor ClpS n=1 Tax=Desulfuromonas thiophila TaxID=57664 RepID=UPI0024A7DB4E|nr:ATP-dependent Clp protease adaptor ClpS [Desulfuromonas thiophila]
MPQAPGTLTRQQSHTQTLQPERYLVIMHNDDYTTMEFVIELLQQVFHKNAAEATELMLRIHQQGEALCGCYPFELAETKAATVHQKARQAGFPLRCSLRRA